MEFTSWISPEIKLYIIKEFQRLKSLESDKLEWQGQLISSILDNIDKCLPIQRHKYEIKMNDSVIKNKYILSLIDNYKVKVGL